LTDQRTSSWTRYYPWNPNSLPERKCRCGKPAAVKIKIEGPPMDIELILCEECWKKIENEILSGITFHLLGSSLKSSKQLDMEG